MTSNEVRQIIGLKPSGDPKADKLVNSNMPQPEDETQGSPNKQVVEEENSSVTNEQVGEDEGLTDEFIEESINQNFGNIPASALDN